MGRRLLNEVSSSQNSNSSGRVLALVDHNYLQPDRLRNTRRTISRHQRNADELDPLQGVQQSSPQVSVVVLPGSSSTQQPIGIVASNSRLRSSSVATTAGQQPTQETNIMQRRNYLVRATTTTTATYTDQLTPGRQTPHENGSLRQRTAQPRSGPSMEPVRIHNEKIN